MFNPDHQFFMQLKVRFFKDKQEFAYYRAGPYPDEEFAQAEGVRMLERLTEAGRHFGMEVQEHAIEVTQGEQHV